MKIAYLLFVYRNPRLLRKLIDSLSCSDSVFFVHVDAKSNIADFSKIRGKNIIFVEPRLPVYWAEFSGVRAISLLIRHALAYEMRFDYLFLLSGSEYPLKDKSYIHRFLELNRGTEFMTMVKMPDDAAGKPISRINTVRFPSDRPISRLFFRLIAKLGLAQRDHAKHLLGLEPYAGNTWWALSREACEYMQRFSSDRPFLTKFFEKTFAPEEMFFQTILGNSPFRLRMRRNLLYEDWSEKAGHPALISEHHIAFFDSQEVVQVEDLHGPGELLLARKFSDENLVMTERMDAMIDRKRKEL